MTAMPPETAQKTVAISGSCEASKKAARTNEPFRYFVTDHLFRAETRELIIPGPNAGRVSIFHKAGSVRPPDQDLPRFGREWTAEFHISEWLVRSRAKTAAPRFGVRSGTGRRETMSKNVANTGACKATSELSRTRSRISNLKTGDAFGAETETSPVSSSNGTPGLKFERDSCVRGRNEEVPVLRLNVCPGFKFQNGDPVRVRTKERAGFDAERRLPDQTSRCGLRSRLKLRAPGFGAQTIDARTNCRIRDAFSGQTGRRSFRRRNSPSRSQNANQNMSTYGTLQGASKHLANVQSIAVFGSGASVRARNREIADLGRETIEVA